MADHLESGCHNDLACIRPVVRTENWPGNATKCYQPDAMVAQLRLHATRQICGDRLSKNTAIDFDQLTPQSFLTGAFHIPRDQISLLSLLSKVVSPITVQHMHETTSTKKQHTHIFVPQSNMSTKSDSKADGKIAIPRLERARPPPPPPPKSTERRPEDRMYVIKLHIVAFPEY